MWTTSIWGPFDMFYIGLALYGFFFLNLSNELSWTACDDDSFRLVYEFLFLDALMRIECGAVMHFYYWVYKTHTGTYTPQIKRTHAHRHARTHTRTHKPTTQSHLSFKRTLQNGGVSGLGVSLDVILGVCLVVALTTPTCVDSLGACLRSGSLTTYFTICPLDEILPLISIRSVYM